MASEVWFLVSQRILVYSFQFHDSFMHSEKIDTLSSIAIENSPFIVDLPMTDDDSPYGTTFARGETIVITLPINEHLVVLW